jgi:hypothetical protein
MEQIKEIKKKGRPSKKDNVLTKNAFEKKEDDLPSKSNQSKAEVPLVALEEPKEAPKEVKEVPKEAPPTAPNTPVAPIVPIDMPKPKKERSAGQIEATKRMIEANKLKKAVKKEIIIKDISDPVPIKEVPAAKAAKGRSLERDLPKPKEVAKPDARRANQNEVKEVAKPKPKPKEVAKPKKKKYVSSSEEESESEDSSSEEKYIQKATRKIALVNSIEARLKQNSIPRTKYSNLSIFS